MILTWDSSLFFPSAAGREPWVPRPTTTYFPPLLCATTVIANSARRLSLSLFSLPVHGYHGGSEVEKTCVALGVFRKKECGYVVFFTEEDA